MWSAPAAYGVAGCRTAFPHPRDSPCPRKAKQRGRSRRCHPHRLPGGHDGRRPRHSRHGRLLHSRRSLARGKEERPAPAHRRRGGHPLRGPGDHGHHERPPLPGHGAQAPRPPVPLPAQSASFKRHRLANASSMAVISPRTTGGGTTTSSTPPWNGWTGSTIAACWSRSATSRRPSTKPPTERLRPVKTLIDSNNRASGKPGAVQRVRRANFR